MLAARESHLLVWDYKIMVLCGKNRGNILLNIVFLEVPRPTNIGPDAPQVFWPWNSQRENIHHTIPLALSLNLSLNCTDNDIQNKFSLKHCLELHRNLQKVYFSWFKNA